MGTVRREWEERRGEWGQKGEREWEERISEWEKKGRVGREGEWEDRGETDILTRVLIPMFLILLTKIIYTNPALPTCFQHISNKAYHAV